MDLKRDPRKTNWVVKEKKTSDGKPREMPKSQDLSKEDAKSPKSD